MSQQCLTTQATVPSKANTTSTGNRQQSILADVEHASAYPINGCANEGKWYDKPLVCIGKAFLWIAHYVTYVTQWFFFALLTILHASMETNGPWTGRGLHRWHWTLRSRKLWLWRIVGSCDCQWEFQDPKMKGSVPYKALFCGDIPLHCHIYNALT